MGRGAPAQPVHHAIVWQDTRTDRSDRASWPATRVRTGSGSACGLPLATYFAGPKIRWLLDDVAGAARPGPRPGEVLFGTIDTWLIWNLTGARTSPTSPTPAGPC